MHWKNRLEKDSFTLFMKISVKIQVKLMSIDLWTWLYMNKKEKTLKKGQECSKCTRKYLFRSNDTKQVNSSVMSAVSNSLTIKIIVITARYITVFKTAAKCRYYIYKSHWNPNWGDCILIKRKCALRFQMILVSWVHQLPSLIVMLQMLQ